jgi:hypothetical protein
MHVRSRLDEQMRATKGITVREPDAGSAAPLRDMFYGTVGSYDAVNQVITTTGTPTALPTGTPTIPAGVKCYDRENAGFSPSDTFYAIRSVNVHTDMTHGQVDWVVLPTAAANPVRIVQAYHSTLSNGEAVLPVHADLPRIFSGNLDGPADIWIDSIDLHANDDVRSWLHAAGYYIGVFAGTYNPHDDEEEATDEERPLYRVQPQHSGKALGLITDNNSASEADWSDVAAPDLGSVLCDIFMRNEDGTRSVWKSNVVAQWAVEGAATVGKIVYLDLVEGEWHVTTELCATASGYSE